MSQSDATSTDTLLGGRVHITQFVQGYRAGLDAVLLAAFANPPGDARVLDVGTGAGAVSLCLRERRPDVQVTGVERNPQVADLARANFGKAADVITADLFELPADLKEQVFDAVISNPPFHDARGRPSPEASRADALHGNLPDWLVACLKRVKPKGWLYLIIRADRLAEAVAALDGSCGALAILPVYSKTGEDAGRVLIGARKGVASPSRLLPGLVIHEPDGSWTVPARKVLEQAARLEWE